MKRNAQISMSIHWIYVLIAGAIILIFFIGIVGRQRVIAERGLSVTVLTKVDTIFTGASLSEQTVNIIDVPDLRIEFVCDEDGYSEYRVAGARTDTPHQSFFSSKRLESSQFITWTLEFSMPFTVTNLLFVGASTINYMMIYDDVSRVDKDILLDVIPSQYSFDAIHVNDFTSGSFPFSSRYAKLVFLTENVGVLPPQIAELSDGDVDSIVISVPDFSSATYYKKRGNRLVVDDTVRIIDSFGDDNPALFAALFSADSTMYRCNMAKAFRRMNLVADVYKQRTEEIVNQYSLTNNLCMFVLEDGVDQFSKLGNAAQRCGNMQAYSDSACSAGMFNLASSVQRRNMIAQNSNCTALY